MCRSNFLRVFIQRNEEKNFVVFIANDKLQNK